ncbi:Aspartyl-tRNA(Asn) amidotransferase subunit A amidotransferase subunit A [Leucobacter sp. 7(1)]|uniref:amidase n=1 Tax=Leucobacter sp. 7(1) TaxID=1255613 RepID=UPI00097EBC4C|nr:amidase family protein [Leucobacter sp. 7(1)]SJN09035.1 Aspartyl-tRNA(Asn) amidotransferase subunit A amidotransferase subunit A [Leucobacter sp. 7(1)]
MTVELNWLSATELTRMIRAGELSAREALEAHWNRIDEVNPTLNAVIFQDRDSAWAQALAADERQAAGGELGLLHGIPLTNKDTNETAGMPNTWGSPLLQDVVPAEDSLIVGRMRAAGAVLTGKSNVPEFAAGAHTYNSLFGTTVNPYDPSRSAGGSSGGAAAAIAAGIQAVGDGSDMGGSLRIPAAFCNLLGLRPSLGRIPSPGANSWMWLGRTGPLAREVTDLALMMTVLSGPDPRVPTSIPESGRDFRVGLAGGVAGLRIGWAPDLGLGIPVEPEVVRVARQALAVFAEAGAVVEEAAPDLSEADAVFRQTRAFDYEFGWGELVRAHPDQVKPEVRENVALGTSQTRAEIHELTRARTRLEARTREYFERFDLWLTPTAQTLPFPAEENWPTRVADQTMGDYLDWMRSVCVVSAMGVPALSLPAGFSRSGLPVGVQLVAPHGGDALLLRAAYAYEQRTRWARVPPRLGAIEPVQR